MFGCKNQFNKEEIMNLLHENKAQKKEALEQNL